MNSIDWSTLKHNLTHYILPLGCSSFIFLLWMMVQLDLIQMDYKLTNEAPITLLHISTFCAAMLILSEGVWLVKMVQNLLLGAWEKFRMYFYLLSIYTMSLLVAAHFYVTP